MNINYNKYIPNHIYPTANNQNLTLPTMTHINVAT